MGFDQLLVTEIFHSLQGETTLTGERFAFIRLTGCNLRCTYCDTAYAFKGGQPMSIQQILETIQPFQVKNVLLTGGEPLLQRPALALIQALAATGYEVSVETHGEVSIETVSPFARIVMDVKTPSSKMCRMGFKKNLPFLKSNDEVKFVIASEEDYVWAKEILNENSFQAQTVLFSPALPHPHQPGTFEGITPRWLAEQIIKDRLPVRFQLQLHKQLWGDLKGV